MAKPLEEAPSSEFVFPAGRPVECLTSQRLEFDKYATIGRPTFFASPRAARVAVDCNRRRPDRRYLVADGPGNDRRVSLRSCVAAGRHCLFRIRIADGVASYTRIPNP